MERRVQATALCAALLILPGGGGALGALHWRTSGSPASGPILRPGPRCRPVPTLGHRLLSFS